MATLLLLLTWCPDAYRHCIEWPPPEAGFPERRMVRFGFVLQNTSAAVLKDRFFYAWLPSAETPWQRCFRVESSLPATVRDNAQGDHYLAVPLTEIPPYGTITLSVEVEVALRRVPGSCRPREGADLGPARYLEKDHPAIRDLAAQLRRDTATASASTIFHWITANIRYCGYTAADKGARYALIHRAGDCSEMSYLFVALCRALDIPARYHAGYVVTQDSVLKPAGFHNWATFFDGTTWQIADPQAGRFAEEPWLYLTLTTPHPDSSDPLQGHHRFHADHAAIDVTMLSR